MTQEIDRLVTREIAGMLPAVSAPSESDTAHDDQR
jgi:hypothetical protein